MVRVDAGSTFPGLFWAGEPDRGEIVVITGFWELRIPAQKGKSSTPPDAWQAIRKTRTKIWRLCFTLFILSIYSGGKVKFFVFTVVELEVAKEGIVVITLDSPENANAISKSLLEGLHSRIAAAILQKPRVLILQATGKAFCAGADLKERKTMSQDDVLDFLDSLRDLFQKIESLPFVTIASLQGAAFGGGLELALCFDFRIASEDASLGLTETKLGIIPGAGGTQRLARLVGLGKAKEWIFSGKRGTAKEALEIGLVNLVSKSEELKKSTLEFSNIFLDSAPLSIAHAKRAMMQGIATDLESGLDIERREYLEILKTEDRVEALNAFQEKRKPIFKGK